MTKNFRPYPEPEDYQELEDEIIKEESKEEEKILAQGNPYCIIPYCYICQKYHYSWEPCRAEQIRWYYSDSTIPDCCKLCSNHYSNGGSNVCHCTLPSLSTSYITTTTDCEED